MAPVPGHSRPPLAGRGRGHRPVLGGDARTNPTRGKPIHARSQRRAGRCHRRAGPRRWQRLLGCGLRRPYRRGAGGRGVLQHRPDRLPGNPDRSVLCRADHHLHLPAYRQCRRQSRGYRGDQHRRARPGGEAGHHRAEQLAVAPDAECLAAGPGRHRHRRRGYPRADFAHPRQRRAQCGSGLPGRGQIRPARADRPGQGVAGAGGHGSGAGGVLHPVL